MFNEFNTSSNPRPTGALEVASRARAQEKASALLMAEMQAEQNPHKGKRPNFLKGVLTALLTSLR